jgi:hypothetical protein
VASALFQSASDRRRSPSTGSPLHQGLISGTLFVFCLRQRQLAHRPIAFVRTTVEGIIGCPARVAVAWNNGRVAGVGLGHRAGLRADIRCVSPCEALEASFCHRHRRRRHRDRHAGLSGLWLVKLTARSQETRRPKVKSGRRKLPLLVGQPEGSRQQLQHGGQPRRRQQLKGSRSKSNLPHGGCQPSGSPRPSPPTTPTRSGSRRSICSTPRRRCCRRSGRYAPSPSLSACRCPPRRAR